MIPSRKYDVIVIGAGPAGANAARFAARGGAEVLLIDRKRDPGTPVRCGEGISAAGLERYIDPDPSFICERVNGARLYSPSGLSVEVPTLGGGYVLERKIFDRALMNQAIQAGAEMIAETTAMGLSRDGNGAVDGVKVRHFGEDGVIPCRLVIGADGVDSRVGRWAGIRTDIRLRDMESCAQYLVADCRTDKNYCEFYLGDEVAPGGYGWIFPKGNGMANVGLGITAMKARTAGNARAHLDRFLKLVAPRGRVVGFMIGGVPVAQTLSQIVADGVMLVGDSARQINPMTGGGIASGLVAGHQAGEAAAAAIRAQDVSVEGLSAYPEAWFSGVGKDHKRFFHIKEAVAKLTDETLDRTAQIFQGVDPETVTLLKIFARVFRAQPKLLWDIRHVFLAGV